MGGLAYDLNTVAISQYQDWAEVLFQDGVLLKSGGDAGLLELWQGISSVDITTGVGISDVIIRGSRFANDYYYVWGSYKGFFQNLHGAGVSGIAWDGFVTIIPAHAMETRFTNPTAQFTPANASYSFPMRLPFKLSPGAVGDAAAIAADSEVGVHALDYALSINLLTTTSPLNSSNLSFFWMGHQRTVAANGTLDMPYIACGGTTFVTINLPDYGPPGQAESITYDVIEDWGWSRTTADTVAPAAFPLTIPQNFPLPLDSGVSQLQTRTAFYTRDQTGDVADTLLSNFNNPAATTSGYYISRIYDMVSTQEGNLGGLSLVVGEASRINAAGTAVAGTVPVMALWRSRYSNFIELAYPASTPALGMIFKAAVPPQFITDTSIAAYDYEGAWANVISPPLLEGLESAGFPASFLVGINNLDIGGVKTCAILGAAASDVIFGGGYENFLADGTYVSSFALVPIAIKGNSFTTATGIALPEGIGSKWTGRAQQQATFSPSYEDNCKGTALYLEYLKNNPGAPTSGFLIDPDLEKNLLNDPTISPKDIGISSLVGINPSTLNAMTGISGTGNIYISGLSNKASPTLAQPYSNLGYGLLAYVPGGDPYVFMYDYGTISVLPQFIFPLFPIAPAQPTFDIRASGLQEGDNMNAAFTVGSTSTTRRPISASWDNDRDQWIFTFADATNGFGFMSVNSAFSSQEGGNQFSFLDQSNNFALPGSISVVDPTPESCIYTSRMMTPILDGMCIIGATDDVTVKGQRALTAVAIPQPVGGGTAPNFAVYTITGSTGRRVNVWVDYLLFDGVDSLIATELQTMGLRVNVENVEWYKAKIIRKGDIGFTPEEIEDWVRSQQEEYKATKRLKERQGRSRVRKRQVQAWQEDQADFQELVDGDFTESGGFENIKEFDKAAAEYVPDPSEATSDSSRKEKNKSRKR
jgi:hypothetical protein